MKPAEDELINKISEILKAHEEHYAPGAWEHFEQRERRNPVLWIRMFSAVAAVLLAGVFIYLYNRDTLTNSTNKTEVSKVSPTTKYVPEITGQTYSPLPANKKNDIIATTNRINASKKTRKKNQDLATLKEILIALPISNTTTMVFASPSWQAPVNTKENASLTVDPASSALTKTPETATSLSAAQIAANKTENKLTPARIDSSATLSPTEVFLRS
ncbi:MAG: hypothetical protein EOP48_28860, partial [Sphingobacteriales bacterium]